MISVIIPVYNVEKYIERCVNSVISQTFNDFEIILVDDGSTDNSGQLCDKLSNKDNRIKVIHKVNGGLSDARNVGIHYANGEYLLFIDSDDYITDNMLSSMYNATEKTGKDIVCCGFEYVYENGNTKQGCEKEFRVFSREEALDCLFLSSDSLEDKYIYVMAWAKLYKKSLFDEIQYPVGILHEDDSTTYKLILKSNGCAFVNDCFYKYLQRDDSIMGKLNKNTNSHFKYYYDAISIHAEQLEVLGKYNISKYFDIITKEKVRDILVGIALEDKQTQEYLYEEIKRLTKKEKKSLNFVYTNLLYFCKILPRVYKCIVSKILIIKRKKQKN